MDSIGHNPNFSMTTSSGSQNVTLLRSLNSEMLRRLVPVVAVLLVIMVVGTFGNAIVCYIFTAKLRRSAQNSLLLCLGLFDLMTSIVGVSSEILDLSSYYLYESIHLCKVMRFLTTFPALASILVLLVIGVDRYLKICRPLDHQIRHVHVRFSLAVIITIALIFSVPALHIYGHRTLDTPIYGIKGHDCSVDDSYKGKSYPIVYVGVLFGAFLISAIALVFMYAKIGLETKRHIRYMNTHSTYGSQILDVATTTTYSENDSSSDTAIEDKSQPGSRKSSKKSDSNKLLYNLLRAKSKETSTNSFQSKGQEKMPARSGNELGGKSDVTLESDNGLIIFATNGDDLIFVENTGQILNPETVNSQVNLSEVPLSTFAANTIMASDSFIKYDYESEEPNKVSVPATITTSNDTENRRGSAGNEHAETNLLKSDSTNSQDDNTSSQLVLARDSQVQWDSKSAAKEDDQKLMKANYDNEQSTASEHLLTPSVDEGLIFVDTSINSQETFTYLALRGSGETSTDSVSLNSEGRTQARRESNATSRGKRLNYDFDSVKHTQETDLHVCEHMKEVESKGNASSRAEHSRNAVHRPDEELTERVSYVNTEACIQPQQMISQGQYDSSHQKQAKTGLQNDENDLNLGSEPCISKQCNGNSTLLSNRHFSSKRKPRGAQSVNLLQKKKSSQSLMPKERARKALRTVRPTIIAFVITIGFIISYLPYLVLSMVHLVVTEFDHHLDGASLIFYNIFLRSYLANNVINIFVYGSMNSEFRTEMVKLWKKIKC